MRRVVIAFLLAAVFACVGATSASANATDTATWLVLQVNDQGFIPQAANPSQPNLSVTAQAITALAAVHEFQPVAEFMMTYIDAHVDDFVVRNGVDDPGALSYVILARAAMGESTNTLITRLQATQQTSGPLAGLFGAADASFDGAFRQGLSLLALHTAGVSNAKGVTWLEDQQCADGLWTSLRTDTSQPCAAADSVTFAGPDTNSSAVAALGLFAQGATPFVDAAVTGLKAVRNAGGGWGFVARADQASDANSTGLVMTALRTINGSIDTKGLAALEKLTVGCDADPADIGGVAFQPDNKGKLVPDAFATVQALPALAGASLPLVDVTFGALGASACTAAAPSTTSTTVPVSTAGSSSTTTTTTAPVAAAAELPRTGSSSTPLVVIGALCVLAGGAVLGGARRRRA
jgi:LPXTG-motif cell wall-anchored protein